MGGRFIPAPAGNARYLWRGLSGLAVHPRACGERGCSSRGSAWVFGSSPRLRGTLDQLLAEWFVERFIPAPAGNATRASRPCCRATVHPRACGERKNANGTPSVSAGSSPRLRGTLGRIADNAARYRFIPAPAGNARLVGCSSSGSAVHPRACGERARGPVFAGVARGSSPRLRGTPTTYVPGSAWPRFIPAPAGNASSAPGNQKR